MTPSADSSLKQTRLVNAELAVREQVNGALVPRLEGHLAGLIEQNQALEREQAHLEGELTRFCEQNVLLKEELA